jgi:hypothetical protein
VTARRVAVVHPPVTVARDFIDYPYHADLGAVQLAAVLAAGGDRVTLVDAFALPGAGLTWRPDERAHLGASVAAVAAAVPADVDAIVVAYTPFHRPPHRDDVLAALLEALAGRAPIVLADCYQSGQHYVETADGAVLAAYPEVAAYVKYEAEVTVPAIVAAVARGRAARDPPRHTPGARRATPAGVGPGRSGGPRSVLRRRRRAARPRPVGVPDRRPHAAGDHVARLPVHLRALQLQPRARPRRAQAAAAARRRPAGAQLAALVRDHGATRLAILDELANVNAAHFDHLLAALADLDVAYDLPNGLRADYLEARHLARMRGRVTTVSVSAESGAQRVLDEVVGKRLELTRIRQVAADAHQAGVPLLVHYMIGLPGETAAEVNATLGFALDLYDEHGAWPAVQYATPLPGTALAAGRSLPVVDDWGPHFQRGGGPSLAATGPQKLIMNVTYVCNNHCTFCAVGTRTQVDGHPTRQREHLARYRRAGRADGRLRRRRADAQPRAHPAHPLRARAGLRAGQRHHQRPDVRLRGVRAQAGALGADHAPVQRPRRHRALARAARSAWPRPSSRPSPASATRSRHAPPGVELGANITLTKHNHAELAPVATRLGARAGAGSTSSSSRRSGAPRRGPRARHRRRRRGAMRVIDAYATG